MNAEVMTAEEWHSDSDKIIALGEFISGRGDAIVAHGRIFGNGVEILVSDAAVAQAFWRLTATAFTAFTLILGNCVFT